ncbi:DNA topoisomerase II (N- region) domain protein [Treponema primitia ZAS-2]|uniref:DNA topoisomerase (ATP-hydrolyzing) n=1 Tax=Treponema primitia (strain ATCC BAA-887 / DSM 12427 / ZAS-2) TaxID=545694 RepID=F5YH57_TREPZ|nr:DNA topoisomerase IV subunit B [Treponema primitia]AEF86690.1 DNA topoisomerase II (N- region) domain protein [Treponema primitia ZAS-2]
MAVKKEQTTGNAKGKGLAAKATEIKAKAAASAKAKTVKTVKAGTKKTAGAKVSRAAKVAGPAKAAKAASSAKTAIAPAKPAASKSSGSAVYDESKIKTLSSLEHIRLRTGMYIGRLGDGSNPDDGIYVLLKEIIDNGIDEFIMGNGKHIEIAVKDGTAKVRDFGRGIPLGKLVECVSVINTGAKYNDDVFQFSVGLNGVGTKAVNALSSHFRVLAFRNGEYAEAVFTRGGLVSQKKGKLKEKMKDGTYVEFTPDADIFGEYQFNLEFIEKRIQNYAYLNTGLNLHFNGKSYVSQHGLFDLLSEEIGEDGIYPTGYYKGEHLEFAFTHTSGDKHYGEEYFSFVNGQFTSDGGTHLSAYKEGFLKGVQTFFKKDYRSEDIREGITAAVAVKLKNPVFESQTKNKLGNSDIRTWIVQEVKDAVEDWLHKNQEAAKKLEIKIISNEKLRTELNAVKKEAREAAKKIALKIPKLKDCKYHLEDGIFGDKSTIFITEGDSASGSMVSSRDVMTQALFSLRGKIENMYGKKRAAIYKNEELYNMMMALGIENDTQGLRYARIVIATDADFDGFHIRNLLLTFFLSYFEELVTSGRVFILETPLFRVRTKKDTLYCYNEKERDQAVTNLGNQSEVTRFKGLGEISPKEFGQFIGEDIRLVPVSISVLKAVPQVLTFYMGKNTPERRDYIMKNLIDDAG